MAHCQKEEAADLGARDGRRGVPRVDDRDVHVGPDERLGETYAELAAWAASEELPLAGYLWESYLSDPSTQPDSEKWQTSISWPLMRPGSEP